MSRTATHRLIPQGEHRCIWMDAGIIDYKLCDRSFQCEGCPFDDVIRSYQDRDTAHQRTTCIPATSFAAGDDPRMQIFDRWVGAVSQRPFPADRRYHASHCWMKSAGRGTLRIGIDHCAAALMGVVSTVVQPSVAFRMQAHAPCTWLVLGDSTLTVRAPLSGRITRVNETLQGAPSVLFTDPYKDGWLFDVSPDRSTDVNQLPDAEAIDAIWTRQCQELKDLVRRSTPATESRVGTTLPDGGFPIERMQDLLGGKAFCELLNKIFQSHH